jgi:AcrR family transcriptional regulator
MPKLIDYGVRFELIREAVVRVAARDGSAGVTLERIAAELQMSPSTLRRCLRSPDVLPELGAAKLARDKQYRRFLRGNPVRIERGSLEHARYRLWSELPLDEELTEHARAWSELVVHGTGDRIAQLRSEHDALMDALVRDVVQRSGVPTTRHEIEQVRLRALVDGLTAAVCSGRRTSADLERCLEAHVATFGG